MVVSFGQFQHTPSLRVRKHAQSLTMTDNSVSGHHHHHSGSVSVREGLTHHLPQRGNMFVQAPTHSLPPPGNCPVPPGEFAHHYFQQMQQQQHLQRQMQQQMQQQQPTQHDDCHQSRVSSGSYQVVFFDQLKTLTPRRCHSSRQFSRFLEIPWHSLKFPNND